MHRRTIIQIGLGSLALWLAGGLFLSRNLFLPISVYDEGFILCGASRMLHGALPHRDFFTAYPLGQYFSIAAWFSVFGESVLVERLWDIAIRSGLAVTCFWLVRSVASRGVALLSWISMVTWLWFACMMGFPGYPYLFCAFLSAGALLVSMRLASIKWCVLAGLLAGGSVLFRHDMGFLVIMAMTGVLALLAIHSRVRSGPDSIHLWKMAWTFPAAASIFPVLVFGLLIGAGCGPDMWQQLWEWPRIYSAHCRLSYPNVLQVLDLSGVNSLKALGQHLVYSGLPVVVPLVVCLASGYAAGAFLFKRRLHSLDRLFILVLAVGASTVHYALARPDLEHFAPLAMSSIALSFLAAEAIRRRCFRLSIAILILAALYWCAPLGVYTVRRSGSIPGMSDGLRATVGYLREHHPGKALFVGADNHDRFVYNHSVIYFLAGAAYGTRYHALVPGVTTTPACQEQIVGELVDHQVRVVVLASGMLNEPNESNRDQGVDIIDHYLLENFNCVANFGEYRILERR